MASRTQTVRNSLLRSSINIKNIRNSVSSFTKGISSAQKSSADMAESVSDQNRFKRTLILKDQSYFRKRQENIRRKDREDEIEASTIGGSVKRTGSLVQNSSRGFLGRLLDFVGILFIGWMATTLPKLIKSIGSFTANAGKLVGSLKNFMGGFQGSLEESNDALENLDQKRSELVSERQQQEKGIKEDLDTTENAFKALGQNVLQTFQLFKDPRKSGWKEDSWDKVGNLKVDGKKSNKEKTTGLGVGAVEDMVNMPESDSNTEKKSFSFASNSASREKEKEIVEKDKTIENKDKQLVEKDKEIKQLKTKTSNVKEDDGFDNDSAVANDKKQPLRKRFNNGYIPKNEIFYKDKDGKQRSKINPEWVEYKKWQDESGFDMFADGGRPNVGATSIVGEKGPELFVADKPGTIVPNSFFDKKSKSVDINFIDRIINNKEQNRTTKLRAAFQLYEKLVKQYQDSNNGLITIDKDEEIKNATVGRLKRALRGERETVASKKIDISSAIADEKYFNSDEIKESLTSSARQAFDSLKIEVIKNEKKVSNESISKISSAAKRKMPRIIPVSVPQDPSQAASKPSMQTSSSKSLAPVSVSKSTVVNSITNKLHELELSYC